MRKVKLALDVKVIYSRRWYSTRGSEAATVQRKATTMLPMNAVHFKRVEYITSNIAHDEKMQKGMSELLRMDARMTLLRAKPAEL